MAVFIYNFFIYVFRIGLRLYAPFNSKARLMLQGQSQTFEKLTQFASQKNPDEVVTWFHCSSLGEFEMARPLIEKLKMSNQKLKIVLTFFSSSGYEIRKNYDKADVVVYLPLDTKANAIRFLNLTNPQSVFFVKYDLWHHFINESHKRGVQLILFNAFFNQDKIFFKWYGDFFRNMLRKFHHVYTINSSSTEILKAININSETAGDVRFDRVTDNIKNLKKINLIEAFKSSNKMLVLGSVWFEDMSVISNSINSLVNRFKIVVAPHEVSQENCQKIASFLKGKTAFFSDGKVDNDTNFLVIDNIGMLSSIYQYADVAYVGGAFGKGLHNIIEPAVFGIPVVFGKFFSKFPEASEMIKLNAAFTINNEQEFTEVMEKLSDEIFRQKSGENARLYVQKNTGATDLILKTIKQ